MMQDTLYAALPVFNGNLNVDSDLGIVVVIGDTCRCDYFLTEIDLCTLQNVMVLQILSEDLFSFLPLVDHSTLSQQVVRFTAILSQEGIEYFGGDGHQVQPRLLELGDEATRHLWVIILKDWVYGKA